MEKLKGAHVIIEALRYCDKRVHLVFMQFDQPKRTKSIKDCFTIKSKIRFILGLDYGANTLKLIEKYNLWNQIDFFPLTYNMDTFYVESNVVVFPSTIAHQARPIFESGAAKKPIIITRSENIAEFVEENKSGLLFRNNNSLELAKLIMRLFKDPDLCRKLGERNYELACQYHNFESMKSELMEILEI